ncbi:MAG TPA: FlgD immunoglobulin-like domain containing protein, partial [Bacteroidota bacterium]|nr:FlgD immunoglobulin-like domain containing protein [Bacteroidota bacterium]
PQIQLSARLSNTDGVSSPLLRQWNVRYLPPPDLAISAWTLHTNADTIQSGTLVHATLNVYNAGFRLADSAKVSSYLLEDTTQRFDAVIDTLAAGSQRAISIVFNVTGGGVRTLVARVQPKAGRNDLIAQNNTVLHPIFLKSSNALQALKIYFDGIEIRNGDYVAARPVITLESPAENMTVQPAFLTYLDGKDISHFVGAGLARTVQGNNAMTKLTFSEPLADGNHSLEVKSGTQSLSKVAFAVSSRADIREVLNYPNPFRGQTLFTFSITGSRLPEEVRIKVFTVAGRLIRTLTLTPGQLRMGFNKILWDGRDDAGDEIANGTYFYKVVMTASDASIEKVERLAKVR